jgi:hypothetical protein
MNEKPAFPQAFRCAYTINPKTVNNWWAIRSLGGRAG